VTILLPMEATIVIMFFLVVIKRLLEILSCSKEMRGREVPSRVARNL